METKYHAQFLLDKEKGKPDAKLRYRVKWSGNIVAFNVGYRIENDKWSTETQRCKANTTHGKNKISASIINKKIQQFETACETVFKKFEIEQKAPNPIDFRENFNVEIGKSPKVKIKSDEAFFDVYDKFILEESKNNQWEQGTKSRMFTQKKKLEEFDSNLSFEKLDEKGLIAFQEYLEQKGHKNSTTSKAISLLKWFLRWAKKKGYNTNTEFELFKPKIKTVQKKIIFLTNSEIKKIRDYKISEDKKYLEKVRDIFLFQCFTGLRYSDVYNLKKSDIKDNYIELITIKTTDSLIIELNKHSQEILNKYKDDENGKALPVISNQKMNDYLKELAELAEINELVTQTFFNGNKRIEETAPKYALLGTHAGRRTFICNALSLGISPQIVMKWTGHNDYKAMKPYIDVADEIKASAMEKFNLL